MARRREDKSQAFQAGQLAHDLWNRLARPWAGKWPATLRLVLQPLRTSRRRLRAHRLSQDTRSHQSRELLTYELSILMKIDQDQKIWQTPVLAMTAQAFLLTVALAPTRPACRGICLQA